MGVAHTCFADLELVQNAHGWSGGQRGEGELTLTGQSFPTSHRRDPFYLPCPCGLSSVYKRGLRSQNAQVRIRALPASGYAALGNTRKSPWLSLLVRKVGRIPAQALLRDSVNASLTFLDGPGQPQNVKRVLAVIRKIRDIESQHSPISIVQVMKRAHRGQTRCPSHLESRRAGFQSHTLWLYVIAE